MTLPASPAPRRRARFPLALPAVALTLATLATLAAAPAAAQDCWLPDALEPNDEVAVPVGTGLHTGLGVHDSGPGFPADVDRFAITIPPYQRLTADLASPAPVGEESVSSLEIAGSIAPVDGSDEPRYFAPGPSGTGSLAVFDNRFGHSLAVIITTQRAPVIHRGCSGYEMRLAFGPRPCDVLADDALEGPDSCGAATVLQPGSHPDLVVFNDRRVSGRDFDYYRLPDVGPGNRFRVRAFDQDGSPSEVEVHVFEDPSCLEQEGLLHPDFVRNDTGGPKDYFVRIRSDSLDGYAVYLLDVEWEPCDDVVDDVFEPNDLCGPYTPLELGSYAGLTLGPQDIDAFEVTVPARRTLRVAALYENGGGFLLVGGSTTASCPAPLVEQAYYWHNDSPTAVRHRLAVRAPSGTCATYELSAKIDLQPTCLEPEIAQEEPNDDVWTATAFAPDVDEDGHPSPRSHETALYDGDVDSFRLEVPPNTVYRLHMVRDFDHDFGGDYEYEPPLELLAFPDGDPTATPLRSVITAFDPTAYAGYLYEASVFLVNGGPEPKEYVAQVSALEPFDGCEPVKLWIVPFPYDSYRSIMGPADRGCATAVPLQDAEGVQGLLANDRPLRGSVALGPGETLVVVADRKVLHLATEIRLSLHAGFEDCDGDGRSLGSISLDPTEFAPGFFDNLLRLAHTNSSGETRRIVAELALGEGSSTYLRHADLSMEVHGRYPYTAECSPHAPRASLPECPCGNSAEDSDRLEGCANSSGRGARLRAEGSADVAANDLYLNVQGLPPESVGVLLCSATTIQVDGTFYDGLLCIDGPIERVSALSAGPDGAWTATEPAITTVGGPGELSWRSYFQVWYRDIDGPCGAGSNTTNAIRVDWEP